MHNLLISGMTECGFHANFALRDSLKWPHLPFSSNPGYMEYWEKEEWLSSHLVWSYPTSKASWHTFMDD